MHGGTGEPADQDKARLDKFNQEFYDTVERAVFRKLTVKDMVDYWGPVKFIITVVKGRHSMPPFVDLHEKQYEAVIAIWEVAERLPDEGAISTDGLVHGD